MIQLDFFDKNDDLKCVKEEIESVRSSNDKVRKGIFARHNELAKMYIDLSQRMEILERNICSGK